MYIHPQQGAGPSVQALRRQAGQRLKELREARGLSQRQLAKLVDVEYYTFISQIEAGRGRIPPERYVVWARALDLDPRHFVRELMRFYDPITYGILFGDEVIETSEQTDSHHGEETDQGRAPGRRQRTGKRAMAGDVAEQTPVPISESVSGSPRSRSRSTTGKGRQAKAAGRDTRAANQSIASQTLVDQAQATAD